MTVQQRIRRRNEDKTAPQPQGEGGVLLVSQDGGVATLTLNRPEARNALSDALIGALTTELDRIAADPSVRAVILAAKGSAFSSGHDLKEMTARRSDPDDGRAYYADLMTRCSAMMQQIVALPQPVIAAVEGVAAAAGCQLVATCDLAVASTHARFATPGVDIGLFCSTPAVALSRNVERKIAMEMLLTGEPIDAGTAFHFGLVNHVVPRGGVLPKARRIATLIASKSPLTVRIGKKAFYAQIDMNLAAAYEHAACVMVDNMMARDAEEGIGAFIDKRPPEWEGR